MATLHIVMYVAKAIAPPPPPTTYYIEIKQGGLTSMMELVSAVGTKKLIQNEISYFKK